MWIPHSCNAFLRYDFLFLDFYVQFSFLARQNNWPPLPTWCPWGLKPCFYQDINVDIPVEFQKIVRNLYYLWVAHAALLLANMVVGILYLFAGGDSGQTFGLALIYWALYTPLSFICWFRPAYKAFRDDSSFNFMVSLKTIISIEWYFKGNIKHRVIIISNDNI